MEHSNNIYQIFVNCCEKIGKLPLKDSLNVVDIFKVQATTSRYTLK